MDLAFPGAAWEAAAAPDGHRSVEQRSRTGVPYLDFFAFGAFVPIFRLEGRPVLGCGTNVSTSERRTRALPATLIVARRPRWIKSAMAWRDTPRMLAAAVWEIYLPKPSFSVLAADVAEVFILPVISLRGRPPCLAPRDSTSERGIRIRPATSLVLK